MLPSAVNDTMRDMMAQIRDVGDGIRGGTYTMTAPVITGGSITGVALSGNTLTNPVITGGSINNTPIGASTANTGAFTTLSATGNVSFDGGSFVFNEAGADKDARFEGDTVPNLLFLDASTDRIGVGTSTPASILDVNGLGTFGSLTSKIRIGLNGDSISSDGDFYIQTSTANPLILRTNTTERMRIDSSGNVGIGTSSPGAKLDVNGSIYAGGAVALSINSGGSNYGQIGYNIVTGDVYWLGYGSSKTTAGTAVLNWNSSGNVGIGTSSPNTKLHIFGASLSDLRIASNNVSYINYVDASFSVQGTTTNHPMVFNTNNTERMRITSGGVLLVNSTTSVSGDDNNKAQVTGAPTSGGVGVLSAYNSASSGADSSPCLTLFKKMTTTSSSARFVQFYANDATQPMGGIVGNGAENVQFLTLSDEREKENIKPVEGALNRIMQLQVFSFNRKGSKEFVPSGFIAQNVLPVYPEYVVENAANDGQEQRYGITGGMSAGYVAELTKAIQEQQALINNLTTRLNALEGK
jgi:hypothetical protein